MNRCFAYDEPCTGQRGCSVTGEDEDEEDEKDEVDEEQFISSGIWRGKGNAEKVQIVGAARSTGAAGY